MSCSNCFAPIKDQRKETRCEQCQAPIHKECAVKEGGTFCDACYLVKLTEPKSIEFTLPDYVRRTHLSTYDSCGYKFLKEVIEDNPMPASCYTLIGQDLHELFEKAILDRNYDLPSMKAEFNLLWDAYSDTLFSGSKQKSDMWERANDSMDTFYAVLPTLDKVFTTEETIFYDVSAEEELPKVRFTMDLITENEQGNLDMHDWKTGNVMVGQKLSTDLQAPLYIYGVQKHFERQVDSFTFYYLKDNKTRVFERINDNEYVCRVGKREYKIVLTDMVKRLQRILGNIKKGNFNVPRETKSMYFTCKMCHIKELGLCEGADIQSWNQFQ